MISPTLSGSKLDGAEEHADRLRSLVESWQRKPDALPIRHGERRRQRLAVQPLQVRRIRLPRTSERRTEQGLWRRIHNFRSALDHLIWELPVVNSGREPTRPNPDQVPQCHERARFRWVARGQCCRTCRGGRAAPVTAMGRNPGFRRHSGCSANCRTSTSTAQFMSSTTTPLA